MAMVEHEKTCPKIVGGVCDCNVRGHVLNPVGTTGQKIDPKGVNHPSHYNNHPSGVECIDIVRHMTFNAGNAVKYLWRAGLKDGQPTLKDLEKARFYIDDEIERVKKLQAGK